MKRLTLIPGILLLQLACSAAVFAIDRDALVLAQMDQVSSAAAEPVLTAPIVVTPAASTAAEVPAWLKRTNFGAQGGSDMKPQYFLESVQPFFSNAGDERVFFNQLRVTQRLDAPVYNIGLGVRQIFADRLMLGMNVFYDYQQRHRHSRAGVGLEAMTDKGLEARVNSYLRVSGQRLVAEDTFSQYYEKVANGFDAEVGGRLPFFPLLKLYGGGEWYDYEHFKNKFGWKLRGEVDPTSCTRVNMTVFDDTKRNTLGYQIEGSVRLAFRSFDPKDIMKDIFVPKAAEGTIDLHEHMLDRVERNNNITVIKTQRHKASGLTIEAGRS